ncbi:MAG: hypothetical protein QOH95_2213 [Gaiellaceae bacterium]|nr:hypothetical protein [Gaiellaceae bacterium]
MPIAMMFNNPNVTSEQYDAVREKLNVSDNPPEGSILHIAGPGPGGGWRVIEVWESKEAAEKFAQERLKPLFDELGMGERPAPEVWQVHNVMTRAT